MKILVLGCTDLTLAILDSLAHMDMMPVGVVTLDAEFRISYAATPVRNVRHADVAGWCSRNRIHCETYDGADSITRLAGETQADFCLVAGWYHMVPAKARKFFELGCAGLHASLLPRLRGHAPLNWAILNGERKTGVSLFALGDGIDDGPIYGQKEIPIGKRARIGELVEASRRVAVALISECLEKIAKGELAPKPQTGKPSWGLRRTPADGAIDWTRPVDEIDRLVRSVSEPYPGAYTTLRAELITIWEAEPLQSGYELYGAPGQIALLPEVAGPAVVAGQGVLLVTRATFEDGSDALQHLRKAAHSRFGVGGAAVARQ